MRINGGTQGLRPSYESILTSFGPEALRTFSLVAGELPSTSISSGSKDVLRYEVTHTTRTGKNSDCPVSFSWGQEKEEEKRGNYSPPSESHGRPSRLEIEDPSGRTACGPSQSKRRYDDVGNEQREWLRNTHLFSNDYVAPLRRA